MRERRGEIELATLDRVYAVEDPRVVEDPEYTASLRSAVSAALAYGLEGFEESSRPPSIPPELFVQARYAARSRIGLDTILRRYFAGFVLLGDFAMRVAEDKRIGIEAYYDLARAQAVRFDRLVAAVAEEYRREERMRLRSVGQRRAEQVRLLLSGELLDADDLDYELEAWHIGAVAVGPGVRRALRETAIALDRRLLAVPAGRGAIWAWFGGRRKISSREVLGLAESCWPPATVLALGEPGEGLGGWRLTHRQAKAAAPIGLRGSDSMVRYGDVALLASALADEVLAGSLHEVYLVPLEDERDGGQMLRQTLAAYFQAGRNVSSAAAALGVNRKTVSIRLQSVEAKLGRSIDSCAAEVETSIRLWELGSERRDGAGWVLGAPK